MAPQLAADEASAERDLETARRLRARDPDGLRRLLEDHGGRARSCLHRDFPNLREFDLDEALNIAAMQVWESAETFDPARGPLRAWFYVIVRHATLGILRREARVRRRLEPANPDIVVLARPNDSDEAVPDADVGEGQDAGATSFLSDLRGCIDGLSPLQRKIIEADLRTGDVVDGDLLAREFSTTRNSIYASRSTARKALRACLVSKGHPFPESRPSPPR